MKKLKRKSILAIILLSTVLFINCEKEVDEHHEKLIEINKMSKELKADIKFDSNVNEYNSIIINSKEEYINFIKEIKNKTNNKVIASKKLKSKSKRNGCDDGIYNGFALSTGFATLSFDVTLSNGCISGISGGFSGISIGVSWDQSATSFDCNSGQVCGFINYNIFYEGIGTVYREKECFTVSVECK